MTSSFAKDTAVNADPEVPGRYSAVLPGAWNAPVVPQGGVMSAVAARAMAAALDAPVTHLRSVSTVFAAPVPEGPVHIDVQVLRRGRSISQATATVRSVDAEAGHTSVAVFGAPRHGFEFTDVAPPDAPEPHECPTFRDPPPPDFVIEREPFPLWQERLEGRNVKGHPPWEPHEPSTSERVGWFRLDEPPWMDDGSIDPLMLVMLADTMPGAVTERMGYDTPPWMPPSADLTVHLLGVPTSEWILARSTAHRAGAGYASLAQELWDPKQGLVAFATQMMFFTFPERPPTEQERVPLDLR